MMPHRVAMRKLGALDYYSLVMAQQPLFYYRMGADTYYTNMEESVEGYDGAYSSNLFLYQQPSLLTSGDGKSVYFINSSHCGVIPYKAAMNNTQSISFSCLVVPNATAVSPFKAMFHTGNAAVPIDRGIWFGLNSSYSYFSFYNGTDWVNLNGSYALFPTASIPYHIAIVVSASGKYCKVYRNGTLLETLTWTVASWSNTTEDWKIGGVESNGYYSNSIQYWRIQEVAMWLSLLDSAQIAAQAAVA